jgi:hypothetical protein
MNLDTITKEPSQECPITFDFDLLVTVKGGIGGIPPVLIKLMDKLGDFIENPANYQNLCDRKTPSIQKRRAIIQVLRSLLLRTDLVTLRVGFPTDNGFRDSNVQRIVDDTGLDVRRINRVFKHLDDVNLVGRKRKWVYQAKSKTYKGRPSKRFINPFLFTMFGLDEDFVKQQNKKKEMVRQKYKFMDAQGKHAISTLIKRVNKDSKKTNNILKSTQSKFELNEHQKRLFTSLSVDLFAKLKSKGLSKDEIKNHLQELAIALSNK